MKTRSLLCILLGGILLFTSFIPTHVEAEGVQSGLYAVILVASNDSLNVREGAGTKYKIITTLPYDAVGIVRTGKVLKSGGVPWYEIKLDSGGTGWVNSSYLTEFYDPTVFCADQRVVTLLGNLQTALTTSNGKLLSKIVSPVHGLRVQISMHSRVVNYKPASAGVLFKSNYVVTWGSLGASGLVSKGSFRKIVLPLLTDVFGNPNVQFLCGDLSKTGGVADPWPAAYTNIPMYAAFKPGSPGVDLDWRTWGVGIEYVDGQPYVFSLIHYMWEP